MKTGSQILLEGLIREGVEVVFGYPGGQILPLYDTLPQYPQLRHILVRHEQGAALAADGYARASGRVGVCFATSGPGATNLVTGIANAYMDSIPMVVVTGQVPTPVIGSDAFQEVDMTGITLPITKHNILVTKIKDLPAIIQEAFYIARSGRPGPVLIDLPSDMQKAQLELAWPKKINLPGYALQEKVNAKIIKQAANLISQAHRPVILSGHGVLIAQACQELVHLAEKIEAPVISTMLGLSAMPSEHPFYFGMLGMHGLAHANFAVHNSDLVIAIGMRFDDRITGKVDTFAEQAKVIHIDIDPAEISKNVLVDVALEGDCKKVLQALLRQVKKKNHNNWLAQIKAWQKGAPLSTYGLKVCPAPDKNILRARDVISLINSKTPEALIATDVGQHQMFTVQYFKFKYPGQLLTSGGLGDMGYGLPAAMGAKVACPKKIVWSFSGDGSIQMNSQELMTLIQDNINVKIAIFNNGFLGMVRQWQELFYKKNYVATPLLSPDFVKLAEAYGILGLRAKNFAEAGKAVDQALKHNGPALIDFILEKEENVFPMVAPGASLKDTRME